MRSDYALYAVAIIFFILTVIVYFYQVEQRDLWIVTTTVLGLFFVGLGYTQRSRATKTASETTTTTQMMLREEVKAPSETFPAVTLELTEIKGIGARRAEQLKALGFTRIEDLAKASAEDLASKLKISPKITKRWIENAKKLLEKT